MQELDLPAYELIGCSTVASIVNRFGSKVNFLIILLTCKAFDSFHENLAKKIILLDFFFKGAGSVSEGFDITTATNTIFDLITEIKILHQKQVDF